MKPLFIFLMASLSLNCAAQNASNSSIGIGLGLGDADYESLSDDVDTTTNITLSYRTQLWKNIDLKLAYQTGDSSSIVEVDENGDVIDDNLPDEELKFNSLSLNALWNFSLNQKHDLYLGLGINSYDTEIQLDNTVITEDSGSGHTLSFGWRVNFSQNFSANIELQKINMGDIDVNFSNAGIEYRF